MKKYLAILTLNLLLLSACVQAQHNAGYNESIMWDFDIKEWKIGNQTSDQNQRIVEFVRPGEQIDNWTELLTLQTLRKSNHTESIDAFVAHVTSDVANLCPKSFEQNVIAKGFQTDTEEASIIYEFKLQNCRPHADQHELAKVIYGKFNIFRLAYVAKTKKLSPETRERWIKSLKDARILVTRN